MKTAHRLSQLVLAFLTLVTTGCQSGPDFEKLRSEILELHQQTNAAHGRKDVGFFIKDISDDYFSVGHGEIRRPSKEEITSQFASYLNNTSFTEYRDLETPITGFSKDGTLAWLVGKIKVAGKQTAENGVVRDMEFVCAWVTLYERKGDRWIRLGEVSSFK